MMAHLKMLYSECRCSRYGANADFTFADSLYGGCSCEFHPLEDEFKKCPFEERFDVFSERSIKRFDAYENTDDEFTNTRTYPWVVEYRGCRYPCKLLEIDGVVLCDTRENK